MNMYISLKFIYFWERVVENLICYKFLETRFNF